MKNTYYKKYVTLLLTIICILFSVALTGCDFEEDILGSMVTSQDSREELKYSAGKNVQNYEYSEKVLVTISDHNDDKIQLNDGFGNYENYGLENNSILSGHFDKVAWNDYKLFVCMDEKYYCFDIKNYEVPNKATAPTDKDGEVCYNQIKPTYDLKQYSEKEMKELYPTYEEFEWYGH